MRYPPALIALAALVVVIVGGSTYLHQTIDDAGARAPKPVKQQAEAVAPSKDVPLLALPEPLPIRSVNVPILMYHRIAVLHGDETATETRLTVDPQEFGLQMQWLRDNDYETITQLQLYRALMEGTALPAKPVLITFDDGYRGIATIAAPIMQRLGYVGTVYVITDRVATRPKKAPSWLTWGHLRNLEQQGWDVGSHTASDQELPQLSPEMAAEQLEASRGALQARLGHPVQWFCYPEGRVDPATVDAVRAAGYVLAVTTSSGITHSAQDPLELSRIRIDNATGVRGLSAALS